MASLAGKAFRFTCPDCPRGGKGWDGLGDLFRHIVKTHSGWTVQSLQAELRERYLMAAEVAR